MEDSNLRRPPTSVGISCTSCLQKSIHSSASKPASTMSHPASNAPHDSHQSFALSSHPKELSHLMEALDKTISVSKEYQRKFRYLIIHLCGKYHINWILQQQKEGPFPAASDILCRMLYNLTLWSSTKLAGFMEELANEIGLADMEEKFRAFRTRITEPVPGAGKDRSTSLIAS